ncbi:hypothetical protein C1645_792510 [Glomus cerebriforme]|uniref:Serine-threonine/tyrosine-protein kinase catalytic domain-containing protein n=1 Tax=Glomus cerebriforme TaxID=658196 RepID=A0A397SCK8_9GLOM|nr:hypothetical protein C1645_792510 [Glomus cerebriforme]
MQKCWHNNPDERPNSATIVKTIEEWLNNISENDDSVWHKADKDRKNRGAKVSSSHPQAVFKSRLLPTVTNESYIQITSDKLNNFSSKTSNNSCDELIIINN